MSYKVQCTICNTVWDYQMGKTELACPKCYKDKVKTDALRARIAELEAALKEILESADQPYCTSCGEVGDIARTALEQSK
jgi:predicted RNA-binding Zn-ribbon protein involved in translation (DUF1610 family)